MKKQIKILGTGCAKCGQLYEIVRSTVAANSIDADIEKVTDIQQIIQCGVMSTPALMVNGAVKVSGRVPSEKEILNLIVG